MRISIIGHNSCGKSTLAKKIVSKFDISYLELDRLWFTNGGNEVSRSQTTERNLIRDKIHKDVMKFLAENDNWVSDGFYSREQETISNLADQIVFIDIPLWHRQLNHLGRIWNRKERHPELSIWDELLFTFDMIRRTRNSKQQLHEFYENNRDKLIHLTSHQKVDDYFSSLRK